MLQDVKGFDETAFTDVHASGQQVTSIRLNPSKQITGNIQYAALQKVPWSTAGYYLATRPSFTLDPAFHAGAYYVQEASSMFLEEAMKQCCDLTKPLRVLDLCAAPGGKSVLLQSVMAPGSLLVSNEIIKARVNILAENITKWGAANVVVTNNDPADFGRLPGYFDVLVVDAPCSGSGLFRKDPEAIVEWSLNNVNMCGARQQRILEAALPALRPGGILIYSTCSYSREENENIGDVLAAQHGLDSIRLALPQEWGIVETVSEKKGTYGYRFYPDKLKGEGFFIAAFRKTGGDTGQEERGGKNKLHMAGKKEQEIVAPYLSDPASFEYIKLEEDVLAIPRPLLPELVKLQAALYVKKAGIRLGSVIRNELIPNHELAVSTILSTAVAVSDVDLATALEYLRRRDVIITANQKGWRVIRYDHLPLGWIKNIGNRINNYYPKEWRILNK
jgi:16S rRNA C967 or C1407 C5-methylase (RsmB/RsmF family)/NOL1/NOP2/fmu family ribosome biogenesis protein